MHGNEVNCGCSRSFLYAVLKCRNMNACAPVRAGGVRDVGVSGLDVPVE